MESSSRFSLDYRHLLENQPWKMDGLERWISLKILTMLEVPSSITKSVKRMRLILGQATFHRKVCSSPILQVGPVPDEGGCMNPCEDEL